MLDTAQENANWKNLSRAQNERGGWGGGKEGGGGREESVTHDDARNP